MFEAVDESTYVVGPGDYFRVAIGQEQFYLAVSPEGEMLPEGLAAIPLSGKTLLEAKQLVKQRFAESYKRERISVSLALAKRFQVSISGGVARPGLYLFDEGARLTAVLDAAGGFTSRSTREVRLRRSSGETLIVDLQGYFAGADLDKNPYLQQGDRISVTVTSDTAPVAYFRDTRGLRVMQFKDGETVSAFIARHDGYRDLREWTLARIYDATGVYQQTVSRTEAASYRLRPGFTVEVQDVKAVIFVGGMVARPGYLEYNPSLSLMDYLALAGITVNTGDVRRSYVLDTNGKRRKGDPFREPLQPGDHILVPRSVEAAARDYIGIISAISSLAVAIATFVVLTK